MANALRSNIPLYRQTDPRSFPDYEKQEYPKVMTDANGDAIFHSPIYQMTTPKDPEAAPKQVMRDGKPVIIGGEPFVVNNPDEEAAFLRKYPPAAKIVSLPIRDPSAAAAPLGAAEQLEAENAKMRELLAERDRLKAALAEPVKKKPGRPAKVKADLPRDQELPPDLK